MENIRYWTLFVFLAAVVPFALAHEALGFSMAASTTVSFSCVLVLFVLVAFVEHPGGSMSFIAVVAATVLAPVPTLALLSVLVPSIVKVGFLVHIFSFIVAVVFVFAGADDIDNMTGGEYNFLRMLAYFAITLVIAIPLTLRLFEIELPVWAYVAAGINSAAIMVSWRLCRPRFVQVPFTR